MQNKTDIVGIVIWDRLWKAVQGHMKWLYMAAATTGGFIVANAGIFGGVAPFGVALPAATQGNLSIFAALGAILGYTFTPNNIINMKYIAAILLTLALKRLVLVHIPKQMHTLTASLACLLSMLVSGAAVLFSGDFTMYDIALHIAEVFLACGATYFFARAVGVFKNGISSAGDSDISCIVVALAVLSMGLAVFQPGGVSIGRIFTVLAILLCARYGGEAGGSVAGVAGGLAMGLTGGDYAYVSVAYGFGGLMSGVFGGLGRVAAAGSFIVVNAVAALFTKEAVDMQSAVLEVFFATVLFAIIPHVWLTKLRLPQVFSRSAPNVCAQNALRDRLDDISVALADISTATKKVNEHLSKRESADFSSVYTRVANRVCIQCGLKTTCWQFSYNDTIDAMNHALATLRRDGSISRNQLPEHFINSCCRLDDFLAELNTQFHEHVSREGVQRKVSKVRSVVMDQFDGMSMMLSEIAEELCTQRIQSPQHTTRIIEYFTKNGLTPNRALCYTDMHQRLSVEVTLPLEAADQLHRTKTTLDLCTLLEADLDLPHIARRPRYAVVTYTEKALFTVELGAYQIACGNNRLCGDAYDYIRNRSGKTHMILSDGMGSGGNAAVDASMASGLITRLLSVGISHEAALKMVNSALLIKSGEESLATLDIASIDLFTGRVEIFKAGAAPTFIVRGGHAGYVESTSLPVGILRGVAFEKSAVTLRAGDVVALVSDGVIATGIDWIKSELETMWKTDVQRLCEKLAMTAKMRRTDGHEDDITVVAAVLKSST